MPLAPSGHLSPSGPAQLAIPLSVTFSSHSWHSIAIAWGSDGNWGTSEDNSHAHCTTRTHRSETRILGLCLPSFELVQSVCSANKTKGRRRPVVVESVGIPASKSLTHDQVRAKGHLPVHRWLLVAPKERARPCPHSCSSTKAAVYRQTVPTWSLPYLPTLPYLTLPCIHSPSWPEPWERHDTGPPARFCIPTALRPLLPTITFSERQLCNFYLSQLLPPLLRPLCPLGHPGI